MKLNAQITNANTGELDPELSSQMEAEQHAALFAHEEVIPSRFPLLCRLKSYSASHFDHRELEPLIAELERASILFPFGHPVKTFLGAFHLLCCLAFFRGRDVDLYLVTK